MTDENKTRKQTEQGRLVRAVLFDNDGTLVDTGESISKAFHHAFKTVLGKDYPDKELLVRVGQPLRTQMEALEPEHADELVDVYRAYNREHHDELIKSFPSTEKALEGLSQRGIQMGVVTSKYHALAAHGLELFGLDRFFETLVGSNDCEKAKPDPAPLLMCAKAMDVPIDRCVYVGDSPYDMQAANAAGIISIAALWGMFDAQTIREANPCYEAHDMFDVVSLVDELG